MDHGGGGGFGGGHGGFGGGHGGFGGGHGGFGGGHGGPGGFGFGGPGFGGPHFGGPGFGGPGPGGFFGPGCHGPGFFGPGPFVPRGGPLFAPWLDALAVTAVAASVVAPYRGYNDGRHRRERLVWTEDGREVSAAVNLVTVRLCRAQNLKKVQMIGKQDPYVRAKLYYDGHQIGECRSSTCRDGGKDPMWQNMSKSVFTFYVPATVTLDRLTLALDVINENLIADSFIGTTGSIPLEQAADGRDRWWNVSTGGSLQAIVELVTNDNPGTTPNNAYTRSSNNNNNNNNNGRRANPRVPVVSATPAQATAPGAYGAPPGTAIASTAYASRSSASISEPQPVYTTNSAYSSTQYRPPPVAPGAAAAAAAGGASYGGATNSSKSSSDLPDKGYVYNGAPAAVPEARAVPLYDGNPSAAYGTSGSGTYPAVPAYPIASTTASQQQQQPYAPTTSSQHQQQQPYAPAASSQQQQQRYSQQQSNQYPQSNQYGYSSSRYST